MANNFLVINAEFGETRVALVEDGILVELQTERAKSRPSVGNIYLAKVTRVLPGMQAAFLDIGQERAAFLHVADIIRAEEFRKIKHPPADDEPNLGDDSSTEKEQRPNESPTESAQDTHVSRSTPIRDVIREGQEIIVQISKDPIGTKGAKVTNHISLAGRYVVYMPTSRQVGISRRIGSAEERKRLREVIETMLPPTGGLVVRTLAEGLTKKQLKEDIGYLVKLWEDIVKRSESGIRAPAILHTEPDLILRVARDQFGSNIDKIIIDSEKDYQRLVEFAETFLPSKVDDIELWKEEEPIFDAYGIEQEIHTSLSRKVPLPSGGYLVIDQAEALTAIDVNTGRFVGKGRKNLEETILQTNLEAVEEIAYQLRFRNIGGLIVLDLIDMDRPAHREQVHKHLKQLLAKDKVQTTINPISEFGLLEMTRKRTKESLGRQLNETCFYCDGTGHIKSRESVAHEILREIHREHRWMSGYEIIVNAHAAVVDMLQGEMKDALKEAENRFMRRIKLVPHTMYHIEQFDLQEPKKS